MSKKKTEGLCTARCKSCRFGFRTDFGFCESTGVGCNYILRMGRRRPCPAGGKCTEYVYMPNKREFYKDRLGGYVVW